MFGALTKALVAAPNKSWSLSAPSDCRLGSKARPACALDLHSPSTHLDELLGVQRRVSYYGEHIKASEKSACSHEMSSWSSIPLYNSIHWSHKHSCSWQVMGHLNRHQKPPVPHMTSASPKYPTALLDHSGAGPTNRTRDPLAFDCFNHPCPCWQDPQMQKVTQLPEPVVNQYVVNAQPVVSQ